MGETEEFLTIGQICGTDRGDSAHARVFRVVVKLLRVCSGNQFRKFAAPDQYHWLIYWMTQEVENGGIDQFFWNRGEYARETLDALKAIGAMRTFQTILETCSLFPHGQPAEDDEMRQVQCREISARFDGKKLDDIVDFRWDDNLDELLLQYRLDQGIEPEEICPIPLID